MEYFKTGKCIWCGSKVSDCATFNTIPHILPKGLGGEETCFDVCDVCNHYFGTAEKGLPNMDLVFKEIFNVSKLLCSNDRNENSFMNFSSVFFRYYHSKNTLVIKNGFQMKLLGITKQFKRSLYEVFLQKYHLLTGDGNNPKFAAVRDYARYGRGDLRVFYIFNNIVLTEDRNLPPTLHMNEKTIEDMNLYGVYHFWFWGFPLYLEIFPIVFNVKGMNFLRSEAETMVINAKGNERMVELTNIMQLDFLMTRFNDK